MKLYNSIGPNPRMVRMFMAEKGFAVPKVEVDLRGGENRREPYLQANPSGQLPALELDDGTVLAEITAICEYVDEVKKDTPSLIGDTPEERAKTRMWTRRIDLNIAEPATNGLSPINPSSHASLSRATAFRSSAACGMQRMRFWKSLRPSA